MLAPALAHIIETDHWPVGQRRINPLLAIMFHPLAKRDESLLQLCRIASSFVIEAVDIIFLGRDIFALLGQRQITVDRREDGQAERKRKMVLNLVGFWQ